MLGMQLWDGISQGVSNLSVCLLGICPIQTKIDLVRPILSQLDRDRASQAEIGLFRPRNSEETLTLEQKSKIKLLVNTCHQPSWCAGAKDITRVTTRQWYIVFTGTISVRHYRDINSVDFAIPLLVSINITFPDIMHPEEHFLKR